MAAFDLARIQDEIAQAPIASPYDTSLAIAVVADCFRSGGAPVPDGAWEALGASAPKLWSEQIGMLAHILCSTSLGDATSRSITAATDAPAILRSFFASIAPLTAEMIRANAFRQEELLRKWIHAVGGSIAGEAEARSRKRLEQLDYGSALSAYARAETSRAEEAARRARLLKEAEEREAAARGWRE
ncbi:MAG: hypothetical protein U0166_07750 [Acidobacteriota bacterium]